MYVARQPFWNAKEKGEDQKELTYWTRQHNPRQHNSGFVLRGKDVVLQVTQEARLDVAEINKKSRV